MTAHDRVSAPIVLAAFRAAVATHRIPASTLTDNGMVFTTRLAGGKGGRNALENDLARLHVRQKNSTPNHPTTCGKVCEHCGLAQHRCRSDSGQGMTEVSFVRCVDRLRCCVTARTGQTDLT